jgi:hypothetical protein
MPGTLPCRLIPSSHGQAHLRNFGVIETLPALPCSLQGLPDGHLLYSTNCVSPNAVLDVIGHSTSNLPLPYNDEVGSKSFQVLDLSICMRPRNDLYIGIRRTRMLNKDERKADARDEGCDKRRSMGHKALSCGGEFGPASNPYQPGAWCSQPSLPKITRTSQSSHEFYAVFDSEASYRLRPYRADCVEEVGAWPVLRHGLTAGSPTGGQPQ